MFGYIALTRAFYTQMKARGGGVILNIIGVAGERMNPRYILGSAGNSALMSLTRALGGALSGLWRTSVGSQPRPDCDRTRDNPCCRLGANSALARRTAGPMC